MDFKYQLINGTVIDDVSEIVDIVNFYEAACTGENVQDNYGRYKSNKYTLSDKIALDIGYEVRRRMSKCEYYDGEIEMDTISDVMDDAYDNILAFLKTQVSETDLCEAFEVDDIEDIKELSDDVYEVFNYIWDDPDITEAFTKYFEEHNITQEGR